MSPVYDAIVLAGGQARRLGGADKPALPLGDRSLLDYALAACAGARRRIVVGPRRTDAYPDVVWCREEPPGGGPVAALTAGLGYCHEDLVLVLAADMPFVGPAVSALLDVAAGGDRRDSRDGAVLVDAGGRVQPLAAVYRREALAAGMARFGTGHGVPMRDLIGGLDLDRIPDRTGAATDCDTWADLDRARRQVRDRQREDTNVLDDWTRALLADLELDLDVDVKLLLDVARDAAHSVARPAAPLTTFLVGYAAAARGGGPDAVRAAAARASALAAGWEQRRPDEPARE